MVLQGVYDLHLCFVSFILPGRFFCVYCTRLYQSHRSRLQQNLVCEPIIADMHLFIKMGTGVIQGCFMKHPKIIIYLEPVVSPSEIRSG